MREWKTMPEEKTVFAFEDAQYLIVMARRYADQLEKCMEILLESRTNAVDCPGGPGLNIPSGPYRIAITEPQGWSQPIGYEGTATLDSAQKETTGACPTCGYRPGPGVGPLGDQLICADPFHRLSQKETTE